MLHALTLAHTRLAQVDGGKAIIPGADMMNTGAEPTVNTDWRPPAKAGDGFNVKARMNIKAGSEILETYCVGCTNSGTLFLWGVYLEDNSEGVSAIEMDSESTV